MFWFYLLVVYLIIGILLGSIVIYGKSCEKTISDFIANGTNPKILNLTIILVTIWVIFLWPIMFIKKGTSHKRHTL